MSRQKERPSKILFINQVEAAKFCYHLLKKRGVRALSKPFSEANQQ